ncbi:MAG: hypothetical protein JWR36_2523 [Glaciihabitans sp.]|nr:hypothetical protein [Glaciihabitans sp.]
MINTLRSRTAIATFTGLSAVVALAGCSSAAADDGSGTTAQSQTTTSGSSATYKDGSYTEQGQYSSPGGQETISVKLTLKSNVVTAVTVTTVKADPTATSYEQLFEAGISKVVVGQKLNSLNVSRVGGSSLTSQGFNAAVAAIKADAKS